MLSGFNKMEVESEASAKLKTSTAYDKSSSFFDNLNEELPTDGPRKGRQFLEEMKKVDAETFGEELIKSGQRGGRGRDNRGGKGGGGGKGDKENDGKGKGRGGGGRGGGGGGRGGGKGDGFGGGGR